MNIIISDTGQSFVYTLFNEDPDYFTLYYKEENGITIVCSEAFDEYTEWKGIDNDSIRMF
jgi:hypothetical protein